MPYSEIRQTLITSLLEKVRRGNYGQYLKSIGLVKIRGFANRQISFDFPVTALVGPNGGGKSTVLGAAACAYKEIKPSLFFPKSSIGDDSMAQWSIEYELLDRAGSSTGLLRRSSVFRQLRWVRSDVISRPVKYFGIKRTVPAGERSQFKKLMRRSYQLLSPLEIIPEEAAREIEHILGKRIVDFRRTSIGGNETFHVGRNATAEYSEFHFGAGESSIIRIVTEIELLPENSLILIEEIENGLHPVATRRLTEYLIAAADRKRVQVIFTTHSDDALAVLPHDAVWACLDGKPQQGKLSVYTLRAISGKIDTALAIFTEDIFAKSLIEVLIRELIPGYFEQLEVHAVAGDGNAVRIHRTRGEDPSARFESLCILDGDSLQQDNANLGIYRLPGAQPESQVFGDVMSEVQTNLAILTVSLQQPPAKQDEVQKALFEVQATNRDPHLIFNQIGIKLGFLPEAIVKGAFCSLWIRSRQADLLPIASAVKSQVDAYNQEHGRESATGSVQC
jgi:predicted ATPase